MRTLPALTDRTAAERWSEVRDDEGVWGDLRPELLDAVRTILETTMEDELAGELVATRYERTGRPQRAVLAVTDGLPRPPQSELPRWRRRSPWTLPGRRPGP